MKFEERLKALRKQVVRFEHGEQKPGFDNLWALADHFKVTVDFLMGRTDDR